MNTIYKIKRCLSGLSFHDNYILELSDNEDLICHVTINEIILMNDLKKMNKFCQFNKLRYYITSYETFKMKIYFKENE